MSSFGAATAPDLSIIVTVYNCAACLDELFARSRDAVERRGWQVEWIFVDDASPDGARGVIEALASRDARVRLVRHEHNRGQHAAIHSGLAAARGARIAVLDGDLEDPPEELPRLVGAAVAQVDIVVATYRKRRQALWRGLLSRLYFGLLGLPGAGRNRLSVYSVISDRARRAYLRTANAHRGYLVVLLGLGLPVAYVASYKLARPSGRSSYGFWRLFALGARNLLLFGPERMLRALVLLTSVMLLASSWWWGPSWAMVGIWLAVYAALTAVLLSIRRVLSTSGTSVPFPKLALNPAARAVANFGNIKGH